MTSPYTGPLNRRLAEIGAAEERLREAKHRAELRRIEQEIRALRPASRLSIILRLLWRSKP
jgi:hypothetical protein